MNDHPQSKLEFTVILTNLNRKFEIILCKWIDQRDFEVRIRTEIDHENDDYNGLCDQWVDEFSRVTNTIWVKKISNTGPKIRFRKQYQCWTQGAGKVKKELLFDARRCRAVLDMKVLTDTPLTRRKNKHIRMGLNAVVKINFTHLHDVEINDPFSFFVHNCLPQLEPVSTTRMTPKKNKNDKVPNANTTKSIVQNRQQYSTQNTSTNNSNSSNQTNSISAANISNLVSLPNSSALQHFAIVANHSHNQNEQMVMCTPTYYFDSNHALQSLQTPQIVALTNSELTSQMNQINQQSNNFNLQQ